MPQLDCLRGVQECDAEGIKAWSVSRLPASVFRAVTPQDNYAYMSAYIADRMYYEDKLKDGCFGGVRIATDTEHGLMLLRVPGE